MEQLNRMSSVEVCKEDPGEEGSGMGDTQSVGTKSEGVGHM